MPWRDAQTIRAVAERLVKEHPHLDIGLVRGSVETAYEELRYARVRTYLPVLTERRAKDLLSSEEQGNTAPDARRLAAPRRRRHKGLRPGG
ncbi:three-helix bundle dimerization domain-containing protein, partial [Streptomyces syringium]|uniref:three-helix bundle dimerization domain-containing protein n=1 Tax=Streptomyces syringium TaxID=76729 RepID=UPI0034458912